MSYLLEIIGFSIEGCVIAQNAGAQRIELCDNPGEGGTTPSYGFIKAARAKLQIDLFPIIRPRGGDFLYSDEEFAIMRSDIKLCKDLGCDGVVTGILQADGSIDKKRTGQLVELAYPMGVTFHRAFDRTKNAAEALEDIIDIGCERILSSGLQPTAMEGAATIAALIEQSNERIIIMPGSGVRADNIRELARLTGAAEFHSSARIFNSSQMQYNNPAMKEELKAVTADALEIENLSKILQEISSTAQK